MSVELSSPPHSVRRPPRERPLGLAIGMLVVGAAACATVFATCRQRIAPEDQVDGWPLARQALVNGDYCYAGRAEYCLDDPAFVDAALRPRLEELYGGKMPPRRAHVDAIIRAGAIEYRKTSLKGDNIARIEELVKERYLNPTLSTTEDVVSADMGVLPGKLEPVQATLSLRLVESEYLEKSAWSRAEIVRTMTGYVERYADKKVVRVAVTLPWNNGLGVMSYRWLRDERRLVVTSPDEELRTTKRLASVGELQDPTVPLVFWDMAPCSASRTPSADDQNPPRLCPPDFDPAKPSPGAVAEAGD